MDTLYLTPSWDLTLDSAGNIALATEPYALAQDAASAIRTFAGECVYDTKLGIPYFTEILGKPFNIELVRNYFINAALTVPDVITAKVIFTGFNSREISGQVQVTGKSSAPIAAEFSKFLAPGQNLDIDFILDSSTLG